MEFSRFALLILLIVLIIMNCDARKKRRSKRNHVTCRPRSMVSYKLTVHTLWSRESFPKMFPTYRPHAQWSALVGRTHGPAYQMWQEGENATLGVKVFAETGDPSYLDSEGVQGFDSVLDSFVGPPDGKSVGQTSAVVFLDADHSRVSFMMRVVPSPDWFIGVNNLNLCERGRWKQNLHVDLSPMDAGTDQGFTFSAPNWPNEPPEPISAITSTFPDHPASSFFYPELKELPRIAYLEMKIVREYRHRRTLQEVRPHYKTTPATEESETHSTRTEGTTPTSAANEKSSEFQPLTVVSHNSSTAFAGDTSTMKKSPATNDVYKPENEISDIQRDVPTSYHRLSGVEKETQIPGTKTSQNFEQEDSKQKSQSIMTSEMEGTNNEPDDDRQLYTSSTETESSSPYMTPTRNGNRHSPVQNTQTEQYAASERSTDTESTFFTRENEMQTTIRKSTKPKPGYRMRELIPGLSRTMGKSGREVSTSEPAENISPKTLDEPQFPEVSTRLMDTEYDDSDIDCEVGEWAEWSTCTRTCGFGKRERSRDVVKLPQNGGTNCPRLRQESLCGSMRNCRWQHFSFLNPSTHKRRPRAGRTKRRRVQ